ncbi:hypothetical protein TrVE_jg220 [Triparma verrucosa]|uniref:SAM domain-containing protein n=1 Tax=Triparma verrucosa TaxID=1606542 RepID=A0A9W7C6M5_9STRA|nr:hypothetical protein TrVE_jg220 [Triparma verrucosa]
MPSRRGVKEQDLSLLLEEAKVPEALKHTQPLKWSQGDVAMWLTSLGLSTYTAAFEEAEIDGMSLFDILEDDLKNEALIPTFGAKKKFLRARLYLSVAYNITSLDNINMSNQALPSDDLSLFDNTFVRQIIGDKTEIEPSPSSAKYKKDSDLPTHANEIKDPDPDDPSKEFKSANMEPWQVEEFKKTRNVTGGITLVTEMAINMFERVHPAVHLVVLVPGGASAEHKALLKLAKEKGDMTIAYGPAQHANLPPGMTDEQYATKLRKQSIFTSDMIGLFFFVVTAVMVGIVAYLDELHTIHTEPGGIVGIVFAALGLIAFTLPRFAEHAKLRQGKMKPLYGEGGTRNDLLLSSPDGGKVLTLMEGGGVDDNVYEDDESEFTPLTPNSRNRKNRKGFDF